MLLAFKVPTPDELQAYATALAAIGLALGAVGGAIIVFIQKLRAEIRDFSAASTVNHGATQTQLVQIARADNAPITIPTIVTPPAPVIVASTEGSPPD